MRALSKPYPFDQGSPVYMPVAWAEGVSRDLEGGDIDGTWREDGCLDSFLCVWANSPPLLPYHRNPEGSRLVERMGVNTNIILFCSAEVDADPNDDRIWDEN